MPENPPQEGAEGPVLLCYDGSPESANAIARAGRLLACPSPAVVASVWTGPPALTLSAPLPGAPPRLTSAGSQGQDVRERQRAERLAQAGAAKARETGFDADPVALEGTRNAWHTLREYALANEASAVVAGARGHARMASVLMGSVSTGLAHHAPVPVLIVPATASVTMTGPLVFGDDGSEQARRAISVGRRLLRGQALVASVWRPWAADVPYPIVGAGAPIGAEEDVDRAALDRATAIAAAGAETASASGADCAYEAPSFDGPAWRGLIDVAGNHDASAIVVGSRGLSAVARTLGSVSSAVAHHSPRPVLVVPPAES